MALHSSWTLDSEESWNWSPSKTWGETNYVVLIPKDNPQAEGELIHKRKDGSQLHRKRCLHYDRNPFILNNCISNNANRDDTSTSLFGELLFTDARRCWKHKVHLFSNLENRTRMRNGLIFSFSSWMKSIFCSDICYDTGNACPPP